MPPGGGGVKPAAGAVKRTKRCHRATRTQTQERRLAILAGAEVGLGPGEQITFCSEMAANIMHQSAAALELTHLDNHLYVSRERTLGLGVTDSVAEKGSRKRVRMGVDRQ